MAAAMVVFFSSVSKATKEDQKAWQKRRVERCFWVLVMILCDALAFEIAAAEAPLLKKSAISS